MIIFTFLVGVAGVAAAVIGAAIGRGIADPAKREHHSNTQGPWIFGLFVVSVILLFASHRIESYAGAMAPTGSGLPYMPKDVAELRQEKLLADQRLESLQRSLDYAGRDWTEQIARLENRCDGLHTWLAKIERTTDPMAKALASLNEAAEATNLSIRDLNTTDSNILQLLGRHGVPLARDASDPYAPPEEIPPPAEKEPQP